MLWQRLNGGGKGCVEGLRTGVFVQGGCSKTGPAAVRLLMQLARRWLSAGSGGAVRAAHVPSVAGARRACRSPGRFQMNPCRSLFERSGGQPATEVGGGSHSLLVVSDQSTSNAGATKPPVTCGQHFRDSGCRRPVFDSSWIMHWLKIFCLLI